MYVQDLKYRKVELFDGIEWQHFRDGWPNIFIKNVKMIAGRDGGSSGINGTFNFRVSL